MAIASMILASINAKLLPTQNLGPRPNGTNACGWVHATETPRVELAHVVSPQIPVLVQRLDRQLEYHALGDEHLLRQCKSYDFYFSARVTT